MRSNLFFLLFSLILLIPTSCVTEAPFDSGLDAVPLGPDAPAPDAVDWSWVKTLPDEWQGPVLPDEIDECEDTEDTGDSTEGESGGYDRTWWENFVRCSWGWRDGNQPCL